MPPGEGQQSVFVLLPQVPCLRGFRGSSQLGEQREMIRRLDDVIRRKDLAP